MRGVVVAGLLVVVLVAGCNQGDGEGKSRADEASFEELDLVATKETGVLRGIVIDETITPLAGVAVLVTGTEAPINLTTTDGGAFGLDGLAPGTYFLSASKAGFTTIQSSAEVVAGVADPDPVKILMAADPANRPYPQQYAMDGVLTCSARVVLTAYPAGECMESDVSQVVYTLDRVPTWGQSEMTWDSTQALGDAMSLVSECFTGQASEPDPCPDGNLVVNRSEGSAPLVIKVDEALATKFRVGDGETGNPYRLRIFAAGRQDTDVINEESNNSLLNSTTGGLVPCVAWPAINQGCFRFTGVGVILQQQFKVYTTVFYGYAPDPEWLFIESGVVPQPS